MANVILNVCVAFIDALAEGISAVNTKMTVKIQKLKETERRETGNVLEDDGDNEMKSFGNFNLIRGMFRAIMGLAGGVMAERVSVQVSYAILAFYPIIMVIYTLFVFREQRKRTWTTSIKKIVKGLFLLIKVILRPYILLPMIYMFLNLMLPPSAGETYNYILTRRAGVSIAFLAIVDNVAQIVYYFVFLYVLNKMKGATLWKCFVIAGIANCISYLLQFPFFFSEFLPLYVILGCRFMYSLVFNLAVDLLLMPMVGRISKYLPEGFESTGVVVVISGVNLFSTF